jgi:hypothetical protein
MMSSRYASASPSLRESDVHFNKIWWLINIIVARPTNILTAGHINCFISGDTLGFFENLIFNVRKEKTPSAKL